MAYDYTERLYDFRPNDFATFRRGFATLTELPISLRGRRLFLSHLIGGGFHRGDVGAAEVPGLIGAAFFAFYMYSTFSFKFSDGGKHQEKT